MTGINPKDRLDAIDILRLPDDDAVRWLKDNSPSEQSTFSDDQLHNVVLLLSRGVNQNASDKLSPDMAPIIEP